MEGEVHLWSGALARGIPLKAAERIYKKFHWLYQFPESHAYAFMAVVRSEPETVLNHVNSVERRWEEEYRQGGKDYMADLMEEWRTAWGLVREWVKADRARKTTTSPEAAIELERL